ncbi:MarR family winged helix-turn-helix transcriptional regulator [Jannaschia sp. R86511]|uniref:MarR family winged helix-turn-helix transcriptional regulator n=1 Tax=Jannaschia sp. R86511 TaxID=3093853 RepID=UPI0036D236A7
MHPSDPADAPGLALALLRAAEWFDRALLDALAARGWPRLTRSQSQLFAALGPDGASVAELARRVGVTRQSMHSAVADLVGHGVLATRSDARDARAVVVTLTPRGQQLVREALRELGALEQVLAGRIGQDAVTALRDALARPWGEPPAPAT